MEFYRKLPRNIREFILFLLIVSLISVNSIAPLVTFFEEGFSFSVWKNVIHKLPFLWVCVVILVVLIYRPASFMTGKIVTRTDSFRAHILINILCSVFFLSIFLTIVGAWIGSGRFSMQPFAEFFFKWPRNFSLALGVEVFLAQPIARFVMLKLHEYLDARQPTPSLPR